MSGKPAIIDCDDHLSILTHAPATAVKDFADELLLELPKVEVMTNRTGLVMLPCIDTRKGTPFHLGEVLVAEARVRVGDSEGYAACIGRDHTQALAIAILDAALAGDMAKDKILAFVEEQADALARADTEFLCQVEATRVELETF